MIPTNETWLCVDLSSPAGTISLFAKGALVREAVISPDFTHSEKLVTTLSELLKDAGLELADMDRFVTTSGPGSFTGLRIALASLKAFSFATGKPIDTLSASEARALAWKAEHPNDRPVVVTYVARDRFVRAEYPPGEEKIVGAAELGVGVAAGATWLVDNRTLTLSVAPAGEKLELYPLHARHLGIALLGATTRKTYATPAEWIQATPQYFGETKYREIS